MWAVSSSDQQPVGILQGEVTRRLFELGQDVVEISKAARIHFVIAVERTADFGGTRGPGVKETLLRLRFSAGIVYIAEMQQQFIAAGPLDRGGGDRRAVEIGAPVSDHRKMAFVCHVPSLVVGRPHDRVPLGLVDMVEQAADPAPNVAAGEAATELRFEPPRWQRRSGVAALCDATLQQGGLAVLNRD